MKLFCLILSCIGFASVSSAQNDPVRIQIDGPAARLTKKPLILVDNYETDLESMVLSPNNIKEINILKDSAATAQYGSKGTDGVILIKTKPGVEFYTLTNFVDAEEKNPSVKQIQLNGKLLPDMKKLLIDKKAFPTTMISGDFKVNEKTCEMVFNDTLVIKTQYLNLNDGQ